MCNRMLWFRYPHVGYGSIVLKYVVSAYELLLSDFILNLRIIVKVCASFRNNPFCVNNQSISMFKQRTNFTLRNTFIFSLLKTII